MAAQNINPFEEEKPKIVHLEKSDSHYEYCRMQMHDIEKVHRRTFFCNLVLCILVCFFSIFKRYIAMFDLLSRPMLDLDKPQAILTGGIFQILFGMTVIVLGYLAWANYRTLNIILWAWYVMVTLFGVFRLDYLSALVGVVGAVFYFFSIRELRHEQALAQMDGYPDFHEKLDISKSDIVIQTLLAHQGERRTKSTLFTTDYSLRRKKKKKQGSFGYEEPEKDKAAEASTALAEALQKSIQDIREPHEKEAEKSGEEKSSAEEPAADQSAEPAPGMADLIPDEAQPEPAAEPAQETVSESTESGDPAAAAAAILAEAEEKTKQILAEAEAKVKALTDSAAEKTKQPPQNGSNPNRKKKKRR